MVKRYFATDKAPWEVRDRHLTGNVVLSTYPSRMAARDAAAKLNREWRAKIEQTRAALVAAE